MRSSTHVSSFASCCFRLFICDASHFKERISYKSISSFKFIDKLLTKCVYCLYYHWISSLRYRNRSHYKFQVMGFYARKPGLFQRCPTVHTYIRTNTGTVATPSNAKFSNEKWSVRWSFNVEIGELRACITIFIGTVCVCIAIRKRIELFDSGVQHYRSEAMCHVHLFADSHESISFETSIKVSKVTSNCNRIKTFWFFTKKKEKQRKERPIRTRM